MGGSDASDGAGGGDGGGGAAPLLLLLALIVLLSLVLCAGVAPWVPTVLSPDRTSQAIGVKEAAEVGGYV